jgi:hypothetical protein
MKQELELRRKWTFRAQGKQTVFIKKAFESDSHVLLKALMWALFLPDYPNLSVEIHIGHRYKPDLVQMDDSGQPVFWGEAGRVGQRKMQTLVKRFRSTHLVFAKWDTNLAPFHKALRKATKSIQRTAPVDLISFPGDSRERFIDRDGAIQIAFEDVVRLRC